MIHRAIARVAALAAVAALGACISLFPKATPSQLYRFDAATQSMPAAGGGRDQISAFDEMRLH